MNWTLTLQILAWISILGGSIFCIIGGIGLNRFPDFYTRMHASGITDTMGAGLVLLGLIFYSCIGWHTESLLNIPKLFLILFFLYLTSATATHALAKSALHDSNNPKPILDDKHERTN